VKLLAESTRGLAVMVGLSFGRTPTIVASSLRKRFFSGFTGGGNRRLVTVATKSPFHCQGSLSRDYSPQPNAFWCPDRARRRRVRPASSSQTAFRLCLRERSGVTGVLLTVRCLFDLFTTARVHRLFRRPAKPVTHSALLSSPFFSVSILLLTASRLRVRLSA
jgi:hypothetical protein